jgi:glycosyltransferase involved in cell wall biosynthesis
MRVLIVHERYQQRGGEDVAVDAEIASLREHGVAVSAHIDDNRRIPDGASLGLAASTIWSRGAKRDVADAIASTRPDLVHFHNLFPLLSPSVYQAAREAGLPVVQTLHNYRLLCPNALLLRDGAVCESCLTRRLKWPGVIHRCYRGSRKASAAVAAMSSIHWLLGTWARTVDQYLALSPFAAGRFIAGGLPPNRLTVAPPAVADPGPPCDEARSGALYVGRLSPEKGVDTLLAAWAGIDAPLTIVGDGPEEKRLRGMAPPNVRFVGRLEAAAVSTAMRRAALLVFPSRCYENFPLVVAEAMAHALPVLASSGGAAADLVEDGVTGRLAPIGVASAWREAAAALLEAPERLAALGAAGRAAYLQRYAPPVIMADRLALYRRLIERAPR